MFSRALAGLMGGLVIAAASTDKAAGQVSGHVVLGSGPIGLSVVFGQQADRVVQYRGRVGRAPLPVRYRPGMSLQELEYYQQHIDYEYELYRRMRAEDAYYNLGWNRDQLRDYVRWLGDERRFLRDEHKRLRKLYRDQQRYFDRYERDRHPRGRGRGVARGNPHR
ncbi:MAG: hypothetical protein OEO79_17610 [Gemmatimonadota bacterium]|nr:hypothetical protein [Gemmatimonadota bacterium]